MDTYNNEEGMERNASLKKRPKSIKPIYFYGAVLVLVVVALYALYNRTQTPDASAVTTNQSTSFFQDNQYYAVFLDNSDVYFGKMSKRDNTFVTLENTFYLRVTQVPQTSKDGKTTASLANFDLVKVGTEVHKPKDKVEIQVSHILTIEQLDDASGVMKVIQNYKAPTPVQ